MSEDDLGAKVELAKERLEQAAAAASTAEKRVAEEIEALEGELETERARASGALEELKAAHAEELRQERATREKAIAAAEARLAEIEAQVEAAEERVRAAEDRAKRTEDSVADERARAREAAASWLRDQVASIRREVAER